MCREKDFDLLDSDPFTNNIHPLITQHSVIAAKLDKYIMGEQFGPDTYLR